MSTATTAPATAQEEALWEALHRVPKERKAEIVNGKVVLLPMTGIDPKYAADAILFALWTHVRASGIGRAVGDNAAFRARLPHRGSFSPDAAYYSGSASGMKFFPEPPAFAVEVRSEGDYRPAAERALVRKRADYFVAGTLVVWDVDLRGADVVRVFRNGEARTPAAVYRRGELAEAEPAVPGWTLPVDDLFA